MKFSMQNISTWLVYFLPITLMTGPAIPDISISIIALMFIFYSFLNKNFLWLKESWVKSAVIFWISIIFISFFAINKKLSFTDSLIFIRYIIFSIALYSWILIDESKLKKLLSIIFISLIFVAVDCYIQFLRYDPILGFGKDIFGFLPTHYGRLTGPFNDQVPGAHLSKFFFISIFLIIYFYKNYNLKKYIIFFYFVSIGLIIFISGEKMAFATFGLGVLVLLFIFKKDRVIFIISTISLFLLIFLTINLHKSYNDFKIIETNPYHLGLTLKKEYNCENTSKKCSKIIEVQPRFLDVIYEFKSSVYYKIYLSAFKMWEDNKLTGIGLNNYEFVCNKYPKYQTKKTNYGNCSTHPHNNYIQWLTESGLIGFIFFIIFIINLFKSSLKEIYRESNKISLIALLVIFWPIMSTGSFLKNWNGIETFFVIGIAMVLTKKMKKNNDK